MRARSLPEGTVVNTETGGGGGLGDPRARPVSEVLTDVRRGYVSREAAWSEYGVRIREDLTVDETASRNQRGS